MNLFIFLISIAFAQAKLPLVINTWSYQVATHRAWEVINTEGSTVLDAVVEGINACEKDSCKHTVGADGCPDELGETTLDSLIIDGSNLNMGGVADLREVNDAVKVAKYVLLHTDHSLIAGNQATEFALKMGFEKESLQGSYSKKLHNDWLNNNCQPNAWQNMIPNPKKSCGPYKPLKTFNYTINRSDIPYFNRLNHDTIGMIAINENGTIFTGTSTNGLLHKIPGRVGDSPIPGAGSYCDNNYGAAVCTGDGDIMMRHLPSFLAVEFLRNGFSPKEASNKVKQRMMEHYPNFFGAIVVVDKHGNYSVSCNGFGEAGFEYSVADKVKGVRIEICV